MKEVLTAQCPTTPPPTCQRILESPSYRVAYKDVDFLMRPEMRAARLELELLKPELVPSRT